MIDGRDISRIRTLVRDAELALLGLIAEHEGKPAHADVNEALVSAGGYLSLAGTELTDALKATAFGRMGAVPPAIPTIGPPEPAA